MGTWQFSPVLFAALASVQFHSLDIKRRGFFMSIRTDTINLIVNVNGNQAQNKLNDLRKSATDVKLELEKLKRGTAEYIAKNEELKKITAEMSNLKKEIGLTALTEKELVAELNKLKALKGSVIPFSKEFDELNRSIKQTESRLYDVRNGVQGFSSFMSKFSDELKQVGVLMLGYLGFQFITQQFKNIIMGAGKLSDQLADLRRVAGLTAEEAKELNSSLGKIDTRTSVSSLRDIAVVAGKLGIAKKDILGFVEAVDMLVVALGDELGNADQITTSLGKILNVFDGKVNGDNISKLGNAIVELANKGVATGSFIADFTQRVAGIAKASNLSLGATVGLSAGFEELGLRSESSATALQKLLSTIAGDIPAAARIAGMEVGKFEKLFAKEPQEALIKYAEGLTKNKASFSEITASFKDAGEEGARVVQTLQAIGLKGDFLREKINLGNTSIQNSSAITEAFELKNQTLGATIDKLGKDFAKLVSSSTLTTFLKGLVEDTSAFIKALKELPKFIEDNAVTLGILTAAIVAHNIQRLGSIALMVLEKSGIKSLIISIFELALAEKSAEIATTAWSLVTALLTGNFKKAAQEFKLLTLLLETNAFAIILGVVAALAIAYKVLATNISAVSSAEKIRAELQQKINESTADEISKLQFLSNVIKDVSLSNETRNKALRELIALNPEYLKGLTLENIALSNGKEILDRYIDNLQTKAAIEATQSVRTENAKKDLALAMEQQRIESELANTNKFFAGQKRIELALEIRDLKEQRAALAELNKVNDQFTKGILQRQSDIEKANKMVLYLPADAKAAAGKPVDNTTLATLKAKLKAIDDSYEQINIADKKGLLKNRDEHDKLEAQINALEGKKVKLTSQEKKDNTEYERLLKEAAKFNEEVKKIRQKAIDGLLTDDQKEVQQLQEKYAALTAKALEFYNKKINSAKVFNQQELNIESAHLDELLRLFKKNQEKRFAEEYKDRLNKNGADHDGKRNSAGESFAAGLITEKQYQEAITQIEINEVESRLEIAKNYEDVVKKAKEDEVPFAKAIAAKKLADQIEARKKAIKEEADNQDAGFRLQVITSKPGSFDELKAKKGELQHRFEMETAAMDKTSAMYQEKQAELNNNLKQLDADYTNSKIDAAANIANSVLGAFQGLNDSINALQNAELARDAAANNTKKRNMQLQVKAKLLSQQQYDVQAAAMDLAQQEKEIKVKREQAQRDKAIGIFNAVISNAQAIAKTMSSVPFPFNIPLAIAQGIAGGLQIAAIEKTPLPTFGDGGWERSGDKHSDPSGGINAKIERDEAIMKADAMTSDEIYTVTGNTAQITSALNKKAGGVSWAAGAVVDMPKWHTTPPPTINSGMPKIMEQGGLVRPIGNQTTTAGQSVDISPLVAEIKGLREDVANQNTKLHAVVSIKEYEQKKQEYDLAKKLSGMNQ